MSQEIPEDDVSMTFWEHLDELRSRMFKMAIAFVIGATVCWFFREKILIWLATPFVKGWAEGSTGGPALHFPAPASLFLAYLKLSMLAGFVFSLPVLLYQLWAFIAPGLYKKEKRYAIPFVGVSLALFAGGSYFGWRVAFPVAFKFLLDFGGPVKGGDVVIDVKPTVMIGEYIEFIGRMLLAFGAAFELPVVIFFLSIAGVVNHTHLIKFARYFVVIAFALSAVITPPDVTSQFLLAVPLCLLYVVSIGVAYAFGKRKGAEAEAS